MSLKYRLTIWVGLLLSITSFVLVGIGARDSRTEALLHAKTELSAKAREESAHVRRQLSRALDTARTLAQVLSVGVEGRLERDDVNELLTRVLAGNPELLGTYTLWEPGAFDGRDDQFRNAPCHDATGRLLPYWNRATVGKIQCDPIEFHETPGIGDFYLVPRKSRVETVLDPYWYPVRGEQVLMTSYVVPIVRAGQFYGIAGVDHAVDQLQRIADGVRLYEGTARLYLLSAGGVVAAATNGREYLGRSQREVLSKLSLDQAEGGVVREKDGLLYAVTQIRISENAKPWHVVLSVPEARVTQSARSRVRIMILGASGIALLGVLVTLWLLHRAVVRPIEQLSRAAEAYRGGDFSVIPNVTSKDELGQLGHRLHEMAVRIAAAADQLRTSETRYRHFVEHAPLGMFRRTIEGSFEYTNDELLRQFGCADREELNVRRGGPEGPLTSDQGGGEFAEKLEREGQVHGRLVECKHEGKRSTWLSLWAFVEPNEGYVLGFSLDITEAKQLTEQLQQSTRLEAVGQLAAGIAHDFNNWLMAIVGLAEILRDGDTSDAEREEYVDLILSSAERAGELTGRLLAFSRKGTALSAELDVAAVVGDVVTILKRTTDRRVSIELNSQVESAMVVGDDVLLQNIFLNLGINSAHSMPSGGRLIFTISEAELDASETLQLTGRLEPGPAVIVEVSDTGVGMPQEILGKIFEPFFTTKAKGTGLGLSAVYAAVIDHRGSLFVYSEPGEGTVFRIYLPRIVGARAVPDVEAPAPSGSGHLLVVDDEEAIRIASKGMLESLGYTVTLASTGEEALSLVELPENRFDLVLLDMIMPGMSGREVFQVLRRKRSDLPVVVASGFAREEDVRAMWASGLDAFLHKPYRKAELARTVDAVLSRRRA